MPVVDMGALIRKAREDAEASGSATRVFDEVFDSLERGWLPAATGLTVIASDGVKYTFTGPVKYREGAESLWDD